jgi:putative transposase
VRKSRFSDEQKVKMVRETEQSPVTEVAKKHGVSVSTRRQQVAYARARDVCIGYARVHRAW